MKVGDKVNVFNLVSENWTGTIVKRNKTTYTVKAWCGPNGTRSIFTHHKDARPPLDDGKHFYVPENDLNLNPRGAENEI